MAGKVEVVITAQDKASAAIRQTANAIEGLSKKVSAFGKLTLGIFAAGRLEQLLKKSMQAAAEHDKSLAKNMKGVEDSFYSMQVAIGSAILGSGGIVWAMETLGVGFKRMAAFVVEPARAFKNLWLSMQGWAAVGVSKILQLMAKLPGQKKLLDTAYPLEKMGYDALAQSAQGFDAIVPDYKQPAKAGGGSRAAKSTKPLDIKGPEPFGSFAWADNQYKSIVPSSEQLAEALKDSLDRLAIEVPDIIKRAKFMEVMRESFAQQVAQSLTIGIGDGFGAFFESGKIEDGFKGLAGSLLSGLGGALVQFGEAAIMASSLMMALQSALKSFLPGAGLGVGIAMVALGKGLQAAAGKAFGNMGSRSTSFALSGTRGTLSGGTEAFSERGTVVLEYPRNSFVNTSDPFFQQLITQALANGQGRRVVFRPR
jgi:hypothetical protein